MPTWTKDADLLLIKLWNGGCSMGRIASEISTMTAQKFSRNAVAGRKFRMSEDLFTLTKGNFPNSPKKKREAPTREYKKRTTHVTMMTLTRPTEPEPDPEGVNYLDLKPDGCKAILDKRGDLGLSMVCGRLRCYDDQGNRSSYCRPHYERYNNSIPRRA